MGLGAQAAKSDSSDFCSSHHQIKGTVRCWDIESVPGLCSSPAVATPGVFQSATAWTRTARADQESMRRLP
ncbi:hypothetical protein PVAP13_3KG040956 [Panicum virgatum]|uniref:Uncharacterized protein n=1 Tax=Panicum virgatum TaxID=38727 RepID=A0A8T0USM1_PANVG|nr:hypothetical protein PVAP13_3KG040956 [Panicum virgatum]